jgi:GNAT superfamily N-acetyltransferase
VADTGYPTHWEADVVLRDGSTAQVRPITPDDAQGLIDFYARVSDESKYYRFFAPYPVLSASDVKRFTEVDHHDRVGFVVTRAGNLVATGRYDAIDERSAEVAFLVQDDYQGKGLGQLLLEHLAQAGRECGFHGFVAEVLPDNVRMIQVFREMGYAVEGGFEDGVMRLVFTIDPTDTALGVMQSREHRFEAASVDRIFNVSSVAVVGASRKQDTIGQALVRNLVLGDFAGSVYAVNPAAEAVSGLPAFSSVQEIPGRSTWRSSQCPPRRWRRWCSTARPRACMRSSSSPPASPRPVTKDAAVSGGCWGCRARTGCGWSVPTASASSTPPPASRSTPPSRL